MTTTIYRTVKSWKELEETEGVEKRRDDFVFVYDEGSQSILFLGSMGCYCNKSIELKKWNGIEGYHSGFCFIEEMLKPNHNRNGANEVVSQGVDE